MTAARPRATVQASDPADPPPRTASAVDTARVLGVAVGPIVAQGVIARRRRMVALAGTLDTDRRGVRLLQEIRDRYGAGPVPLRLPGRSVALVLDPADVTRVLDGAPEPFAPASWEKRGALRHFQPHGVLVSRGEVREQRRAFNESVLDTGRPLHRHAAAITRVVREETGALRDKAVSGGVLDWDAFITTWWRVVRRVVLGDGARDDDGLTDDLTVLRHAANWSGVAPRHHAVHARFRQRLSTHLDRAEPGSLAEIMAGTPAAPGTDPVDQVPQWLFAFDPAGAATLRTLAVVVAHPEVRSRIDDELAGRDLDAPQDVPLLRASVLESVRLWPTTPLLLRDTTEPTRWRGGTLPTGTAMLIPTWFLHRDDHTRTDADVFAPDAWLNGVRDADPAIVPFSAGPAVCPGRELVLFTATAVLATLLAGNELTVLPPGLIDPARPLPGGLDPFALKLTIRRRP